MLTRHQLSLMKQRHLIFRRFLTRFSFTAISFWIILISLSEASYAEEFFFGSRGNRFQIYINTEPLIVKIISVGSNRKVVDITPRDKGSVSSTLYETAIILDSNGRISFQHRPGGLGTFKLAFDDYPIDIIDERGRLKRIAQDTLRTTDYPSLDVLRTWIVPRTMKEFLRDEAAEIEGIYAVPPWNLMSNIAVIHLKHASALPPNPLLIHNGVVSVLPLFMVTFDTSLERAQVQFETRFDESDPIGRLTFDGLEKIEVTKFRKIHRLPFSGKLLDNLAVSNLFPRLKALLNRCRNFHRQ